MEFLRFLSVAVMGVIVDITLSWLLFTYFGVPLWSAVVCGFLTAAAINYLLHELWTFRGGAQEFSRYRAAKYLGALSFALAARLGTVTVLQIFYPTADFALMILIIGAGVSFGVNFVASKLLVFTAIPVTNGRASMSETAFRQFDDSDWELPSFEESVFVAKRNAHALVIPVINEGDRIREQLERIRDARLNADVIVADGGSTDGSLHPDFIETVGVRAVLTKTGSGKLSAQLRMAYAWCIRQGYEGVVTIDGNGKDGVEAVNDMVERLKSGYDYVQGSRYIAGGKADNTPLDRTVANRFIHAPLLSLAGRHWFTDTTNGFRAYSTRYLLHPAVKPFRDVFQQYELLFYLTVRAGQIGMKVGHLAVRRSYPHNADTPTKITGLKGKFAVLTQTFAAAVGSFKPRSYFDANNK